MAILPLEICGWDGVHVQAKNAEMVLGYGNKCWWVLMACKCFTFGPHLSHMGIWLPLSSYQLPFHTCLLWVSCCALPFPVPRVFPGQTTELSGQMSRLFAHTIIWVSFVIVSIMGLHWEKYAQNWFYKRLLKSLKETKRPSPLRVSEDTHSFSIKRSIFIKLY